MATKTATQLRAEAAAIDEKLEALVDKRDALIDLARAQEALATLPLDTPLIATRRGGEEVQALFKGAKDTERGILVAVQVGEGFDAEVLRLPLSKVRLANTADAAPTAEVPDGVAA